MGTAGQGSIKLRPLTETPDAAQPAADAAVQPETAAQPETTAQPGSTTIVAGGVAGGVGAGAGAGVAGSVSGEGSADLNGELTVTVPDIKLDASNQVTAARNDLSSSLNDISDRVRSLTNSTGSNAQNLIDDLRAVADQMEQIVAAPLPGPWTKRPPMTFIRTSPMTIPLRNTGQGPQLRELRRCAG